jgi:hypothetical protein
MKNWRALLIGCFVACSMGFGLAQAVAPAVPGAKTICPACGNCTSGGHRQAAGFCLCCNDP